MGRMTVVAAVAVAAIAAVGAWMVLRQDTGAAADGSPESAGAVVAGKKAAETGDWRSKVAALGGKLGVLPDASDEALKKTARTASNAAGVAKWLKQQVADKRLVAVVQTRARRHAVRSAKTLHAQLQAGAAKGVHDVEVAWLAAALLKESGGTVSFVTDAKALATPLLLSRTRVAVKSGETVVAPIQAIQQPAPISEAQAAAWWLIQKAYVKRAAKAYKDAHKLLALAREIAPNEHATDFARGVIELDQGLIDRGIERCAGALAKQDDPIARVFLADVLNQLQRPFKAWQQIDAALRKHPKLPEAHASKGLIEATRVGTLPENQKAAKLDEAAAALRRALELDPKVPGARAGLAQVLLMKNDLEGAQKLLIEGVDTYRDTACADVLSKLWSGKDKAAELLQKLKPLESTGDPRVIIALVGAHASAGSLQEGLAVAERAHKADPEDPDIALLRADLLRQAGKTDEALAALQSLHEKTDDQDVTLLYAQLLLQNKKTDRAIGLLEPVAKQEKRNPQPAMLLLIAYKHANKTMEADALIERVQRTGMMTADQVAGTLIEMGDADAAVSVLEKTVNAGRPTRESAVLLAMIYTASKRRKDAEALRDKLVAAAGDKGEELKKAMNEAIEGAAAELEQMNAEDAAAAKGQPQPAPAPKP